MEVKKLDFEKTDDGWKFIEEIIKHPTPDAASRGYGYLFVDIDTTLDELLEKLKRADASVAFNTIHLEAKRLPLCEDLRDDLLEEEDWEELRRFDSGKLPSLRYKDDSALINEIMDAVKTGHLAFNKTCIDFLKEGQSEFYSGTKDNIKMVLKHKQRK